MDKVLEIIENIIGDKPQVRFQKAFEGKFDKQTGIIDLTYEQVDVVMQNKGIYLKTHKECNRITIQRAMTRRQQRVNKALRQEIENKEDPPEGKKYIIRNGEIATIKLFTMSTKNGQSA